MKFKIFKKENYSYLLLFLLSFWFYFYYYQNLVLNLNSVLFGTEGDSLKNYYTFLYHIKNDTDLFRFSGMNYPFGEHIVYTDCQPLLTFVFKIFPFASNYAIGTMHFLVLLSFIITPLILYRIFGYFNVNRPLAFFSSLAIAILSPQIHRIGGHFGMAYGCVIPLAILLLLRYHQHPHWKKVVGLFAYNSALFLIHPYLGFGSSIFCFLCVFITGLLNGFIKNFLPSTLKALLAGGLPMLLFTIFLALTDHRTDRTPEPYGIDIMAAAANIESVFTPSFGPFDHFLKHYNIAAAEHFERIFTPYFGTATTYLKRYIHTEHVEWEALSYVGLFPMCLCVIAIIALPFYFRRINISKELLGLFLSSLLLLIFAFGVQVKLFEVLNIKLTALNQFRCLGRYAWFFYFMLPVFLISALSNLKHKNPENKFRKICLTITGILFLSLNLVEGHHLLTYINRDSFVAKNIFNENTLNDQEKKMLELVRQKKFTAIVPFPMFHIGSDVYQKNGDEVFLPALLYSFYANLPIIGEVLSRTSVQETETAMELMNRYKKYRKIDKLLEGSRLLIIKAGNNLREDEWRVVRTLNHFHKYEDLEFFSATTDNFKMSNAEKNNFKSLEATAKDRQNIIFIPFEKHKPFLSAKISDYQKITELDSNRVSSGDYVVSFHYYMKEKKFRYLYNHLIVVKKSATYDKWEYFNSIRSASGFYDSMIVYEQKINIDPHFQYEFILNGSTKENYRVSDFLLRPAAVNVKMIKGGLTSYNNFPE